MLPAMRQVSGLAVAADAAGNVFVADIGKAVVYRVSPSGTLTSFAGTGTVGYGGNGGPAGAATLGIVTSIATDARGALFIGETVSPRVRKVTPDGIMTTVAGNGTPGTGGDGGQAINAQLCPPTGLAVDSAGNLFIASGPGPGVDSMMQGDYRIRRVAVDGVITTIAGNGLQPRGGMGGGGNPPADGSAATSGSIWTSQIAAGDPGGHLYFADGPSGHVRKIAPTGVVTTVAGVGSRTGVVTTSGDGGPAMLAYLGSVIGLSVDRAGHLFIATGGRDQRVRRIDSTGVIQTIAGDGTPGYEGDGGPATTARLSISAGRGGGARISVDGAGNLFIAEKQNVNSTGRIRKVTPDGSISTFATLP
jgi:sugar lactone lactonase YvrE